VPGVNSEVEKMGLIEHAGVMNTGNPRANACSRIRASFRDADYPTATLFGHTDVAIFLLQKIKK
jgi:hypothetical protein